MNTRLLITSMAIVTVVWAVAWGDPDFTLQGIDGDNIDFMAVTADHDKGTLNEFSSVDIQTDGYVGQLSAYFNSDVLLSGGSVRKLDAAGNSSVTLSDGSVASLYAEGSSTVNVSGGIVDYLGGYGDSIIDLTGGEISYLDASSSTVSISGGVVDYLADWGDSIIDLTGGAIAYLEAGGSSLTTFYGYGWSATDDLSIVGGQVFGTGILGGFWADGTTWNTVIGWNDVNATISLVSSPSPSPSPIPAPGALLLGAMGSSWVIWLRRRRAL